MKWVFVAFGLITVLLLMYGCNNISKNDIKDIISDSEIKPIELSKPAANPEVQSNETITADIPENSTTDINETDNSTETVASGEQTQIDLKVKTMYWETIYPSLNENNQLTVQIENIGTSAVSKFDYYVNVTHGDEQIKNKAGEAGPINPGESITITPMSLSLSVYGDFPTVVQLDPFDKIIELNEKNNKKELTIKVIQSEDDPDVEEDTPTTPACDDSDGGIDYANKGACTDETAILGDLCVGDSKILESYCNGNRCDYKSHDCLCLNNVCVD